MILKQQQDHMEYASGLDQGRYGRGKSWGDGSDPLKRDGNHQKGMSTMPFYGGVIR